MVDLHRVLDYDELLDDPAALAVQKCPDTHDLVMKTIEGGRAWRDTRDKEAELLKQKRKEERLAELRRPEVRTVGAIALLECIKHKTTVVHVFGDNCKDVDRAMAQLQIRAPNLSLLRLDKAEAAGDMHEVDDDALPALLFYHQGELVATRFNVKVDDADDIEDILDELGLPTK